LHTADKWLSLEGRVIKEGEEPLKMVKSRSRPGKSAIRFLNDDDADENVVGQSNKSGSTFTSAPDMVGLYGLWQTKVYVPPDIVNGVIPKNKYGNFELFLPSMLPKGASHVTEAMGLEYAIMNRMMDTLSAAVLQEIRQPSLKRVARKIGIDFAEAVTGFDVRCGRSVPRIEGVVVTSENVNPLLEQYADDLGDAFEKLKRTEDEEMAKAKSLKLKKSRIQKHIQERYEQDDDAAE
jgi:xeroderma pigmentosum group C-complementing protein